MTDCKSYIDILIDAKLVANAQAWKQKDQAITTPKEMLELAERNLEAIIVRCEEGDRRSDWLPIIAQLAKDTRTALRQAQEK